MIHNDAELQVTLGRIGEFHKIVSQLRTAETNPEMYRASASGFLVEIDRMNLDVRDYLRLHPKELAGRAA
jgi:hypothetical protein